MRWSYSNLAKLIWASANYHVQWNLILQITFFAPSDVMESFARMQSNIALLHGSKKMNKSYFF